MAPKKTIQSAARVAGKNGFSLISDDTFRKLYAILLQCRMLDERLAANPTYCRWPGRETCTAGVAICLHPGDRVTPTPRGLLARYFQSGSLRLSGPALTPTSQLAAGTADGLRCKLESSGNIAVVYADTGVPERMREVFAAAADQRLPVLYVLEAWEALATVCGKVPMIRVDRCDAVAGYRVAHESIARAREGMGPTIIECVSWSGENEPQDPLVKLERYLADKRLFRQDWRNRIEKTYEASLNEAVRSL